MDARSTAFLEIMIGIAVVGVLAFLVLLLAGRIRMATSAGARQLNIRWPQVVLALILLIAVAAIVVWQFPPLDGDPAQAKAGRWRSDPDALSFFIVMLAVAGGAVLVFLITLVIRAHPRLSAPPADEEEGAEKAVPASVEAPSAARLFGLLLPVAAILLLCWVALKPEQQYALVLYLLYPASLAVALVMLFDKATRSWSAKNGGESFREWLFCDLLVFFLILGFLNLLDSNAGAKYEALIWDMLHLAAFFLVFWLLDRRLTRLRFLAAYLYLALLPVLLLIWRAMQGVPAAKDPSWWETIWPLFSLGVIFFVLELIAVIASSDREKQAVPAIKDGLYVVLVGIVLIVAVPAVEG